MEVRISRLSIASLIAATAFYVPVASGLAAVVLGIASIKAINGSGGSLLGKKIAQFSIAAGAIHAVVWVALLWPGSSFEVPTGATGVVFRDQVPVRALGYGHHRKLPLLEAVTTYPTGELNQIGSEAVEVLLNTSEIVRVKNSGLWSICEPMEFARTFGQWEPIERAQEKVEFSALAVARIAASREATVQELVSRGLEGRLKDGLSEELKGSGICIMSFTVGPAK